MNEWKRKCDAPGKPRITSSSMSVAMLNGRVNGGTCMGYSIVATVTAGTATQAYRQTRVLSTHLVGLHQQVS